MFFGKIPDDQFFYLNLVEVAESLSYISLANFLEFSMKLRNSCEIIQSCIDLNIRGERNPVEWKVTFSAVL